MQLEATAVVRTKRAFSATLTVALYLLVGLLETILAYFVFSRADDHEYFLKIANHGLSTIPTFMQEFYDFKAKAAGMVFYIMTTPSRLLGGHELIHLLWLRLLTLMGFWCAFEWLAKSLAPKADAATLKSARAYFFVLCLLYPGQLAWTASLLRDGVATTLFMASLLAFRHRYFVWSAPVLMLGMLALRPEYGLILTLLLCSFFLNRWLVKFRHRALLLLAILATISIVTYPFQSESSAFAQYAFGAADMAFPPVNDIFDIRGYFLIFVQGLIDPIFLNRMGASGVYPIAETIFFSVLLWQGLALVRKQNNLSASLAMVVLIGLWIFAYFELAVSGFSRHRLPLEVLLIGLIVLSKIPQNPGIKAS